MPRRQRKGPKGRAGEREDSQKANCEGGQGVDSSLVQAPVADPDGEGGQGAKSELVERLERLVEAAKAGKITGACGATMGEGRLRTFRYGMAAAPTILALETLKLKVIQGERGK